MLGWRLTTRLLQEGAYYAIKFINEVSTSSFPVCLFSVYIHGKVPLSLRRCEFYTKYRVYVHVESILKIIRNIDCG